MAAPGTFTFQLLGELEKESEAKKGITKLMFLHICAEINFKESSVSSIDRNCNMLPLRLDDLLNYSTLMLQFFTK
jgi:hypothetical protein